MRGDVVLVLIGAVIVMSQGLKFLLISRDIIKTENEINKKSFFRWGIFYIILGLSVFSFLVLIVL